MAASVVGMTTIARWGRNNWCFYWGDKAYGPMCFETREAAESFLAFVADRTGLDPRYQTDDVLERMADEWTAN